MRIMQRRIEKLENVAGSVPAVVGRQFGEGAPVQVRGEEMSREVFHERYPWGTLVVYDSDTPAPDSWH